MDGTSLGFKPSGGQLSNVASKACSKHNSIFEKARFGAATGKPKQSLQVLFAEEQGPKLRFIFRFEGLRRPIFKDVAAFLKKQVLEKER